MDTQKLLGEFASQLLSGGIEVVDYADRRMAARLGYMHEAWIGDLVAAQVIAAGEPDEAAELLPAAG